MDSESLRTSRLEFRRSTTQQSSVSFLERKLRLLTQNRSSSESAVEVIGNLGLNLLFQPDETLADFIFVHGLRGGSRKTWSASTDPAHFWPKEWLPGDPDFKNVRIHTFGYHSDWGESKTKDFNIHDFGQSLVEEMHSSPTIGQDHDVPIVLIGHSMGGLVIKKAVILSKENPIFQRIGERIHSLFFLATPHRGSDLAKILNNIMKVSFQSTKAYVTNLERGSEATQLINDQFRHYYSGIHLHSFLESIPMNLGYGTALVVDRSSAILGYPEERVQVFNADHRNICKFDTPLDPNFQTLRTRMASTVSDILRNASKGKQDRYRDQMRKLSMYLNISDGPVDDLSALEDDRLDGSCEWLTDRESFQNWQFNEKSSRYFWLRGKPAMGKTVIASHVIRHLEGNQCSYFFFKHGDRVTSSLAALFRSMAFQMAGSNRRVRENLIDIQQDDPHLDVDNVRSIWRKVYGAVFGLPFHQPHYWVIDALDECRAAESRDFGGLFSLLSKIDSSIPLKVFITSRFSFDIDQCFAPLHPIVEQLTIDDTSRDIRMYVENNSQNLPVETEAQRQDMVETIIEKSSGCFLWAVLVIRQLQDVLSLEEVEEVLKEVPIEMENLYLRNLEILSKKERQKRLAITIITWTLFSMRAITTVELKEAIKLETNQTVSRDLEKSIPSLCGQMVQVDRYSRVKMIHHTASSFLTNEGLESEFRINRSDGHLRLAIACLKYLNSDAMKVQKKRRSSPAVLRESPHHLASYACSSFSEHLLRATSSNDELLELLTEFLQSNVLTWIERAAQTRRLDLLIRAAKHFKAYLDRRAKNVAPLGRQIKIVSAWATDLPRIVGEFGANLISDPSAIHLLIPPLCPRNSIINQKFAESANTFQVAGPSFQEWQDRISCIGYRNERAKSIACRDGRFAVGLSDGNILVYYATTCQEAVRLEHGDPALVLEFGNLARLLASSSRKSIRLWDVTTSSLLFNHPLSPGSDPLTIAFNEDETIIFAATRSKEYIALETSSGAVVSRRSWTKTSTVEAESIHDRAPTGAEISMEHQLMAITFRGMPVFLWDLRRFRCIGTCKQPTQRRGSVASNITGIALNPNPELELLAVAYFEGQLALYDTATQIMTTSISSDSEVLAASADGRTLAGGDSSGQIQLFEFDTLHLLIQISLPDYSVKAMKFSSDSLRLFDLRDPECNIWEPSVLVRKDVADKQSEPSEAHPAGAVTVGKLGDVPIDNLAIITAVSSFSRGKFTICGSDDGRVVLYDLVSGRPKCELYRHARACGVTSLQWNETKGVVSSVDISSRLQVLQLEKDSSKAWKVREVILDERFDQAIQQQLLSPDGKRLLIYTKHAAFSYSLETKLHLTLDKLPTTTLSRWAVHPSRSELVMFLNGHSLETFTWEDLKPFSETINIEGFEDCEIDYEHIATSLYGMKLLIKFSSGPKVHRPSSVKRISQISILDLSTLNENTLSIQANDYFVFPNALDIDFIIGTTSGLFGNEILVFLTTSGWICSIDIDNSTPQETFLRHFFVPFSWLSNFSDLVVRVTEKRDVIFVQRDEIAVFKQALDRMECVCVRDEST